MATICDAHGQPIPRNVSEWFLRKLDASHKVSARTADYSKKPHVSPEAAALLSEKAAAWAHLVGQERNATREREHARLESLATSDTPDEFQNGKVVLPTPTQPLSSVYCWKPDFEGEVYQAVLHYYQYLPAEHTATITAPNGYPAKVMSPEAARLYRDHRCFWEAKHAQSKAESADRRKLAEAGVEKAATSAGLSRVELESKLDRLAMLVEESNLLLAAEMIAGFGDAWLYEALLAGTSVEPDGDIKPGRILKRFGGRAECVVVLALSAMPDGVPLDRSLHRDALMNIAVDAESLEVVAEIAPRLSNLRPRGQGAPFQFENLRESAAEFLARHVGALSLDIPQLELEVARRLVSHEGLLTLGQLREITPAVASALAQHRGALSLGLTEISEAVAVRLAGHRDDLSFPNVLAISPAAAAALSEHTGTLTLGVEWSSFDLGLQAARHLGRHGGPINLPGVRQLHHQAVVALAAQAHGVRLGIERLPAGTLGVRLCQRMAASPGDSLRLSLTALDAECASVLATFAGTQLSFPALESLTAECAAALSAFPRKLSLGVTKWTDEALIALARQQGELDINPPSISSSVAVALSQRGPGTSLTFSGYSALSLSDEAVGSLGAYRGKLAFLRDLSMSAAAARGLTERDVLVLSRSHLKQSQRQYFDSTGAWKHGIWFRHDRSARSASQEDARG